MKRRSALQLGGATFASFLGGCSARTEVTTVSVSEIVVRNRLDHEIDVSVLLVDAGEVTYWQTVSVPADPNPFATLEDIPSVAGEYALYAQVPTSENDPPVHTDLTEGETNQSCITVGLEVTMARVNGGDVPSVVYGTIGKCRTST